MNNILFFYLIVFVSQNSISLAKGTDCKALFGAPLIKVDTDALQINIPGFPHVADFSKKMMEAVKLQSDLLKTNPNRDLRLILNEIARWRGDVGHSLGDKIPPQYFILRDDAPVPLDTVTPIRNRFQQFFNEAQGKINTLNYKASRQRWVGNQIVTLTWIRQEENGALSWVHPTVEDSTLILAVASDLLGKLMSLDTKKNKLHGIAEIHWWLANATPFVRGSASIVDAFTKVLMMYFDLPISKWKPGIAPDIEAFHQTLEDFIQAYPTLFENN